jgi:hypothetical protein
MPNQVRKRSEFEIMLSDHQLEAFLKIAAKEDRPIEEVVLEALDKYIERAKESWRK